MEETIRVIDTIDLARLEARVDEAIAREQELIEAEEQFNKNKLDKTAWKKLKNSLTRINWIRPLGQSWINPVKKPQEKEKMDGERFGIPSSHYKSGDRIRVARTISVGYQ